MVLITAQLGVARPDWGQRKVRNITPGTHFHLGKLGWRHVLPMSHLSWGVPVLTSPVRLLGWFIYVRWSQLSVWHRRRTTSVILLLVTTGCVTSLENTIWVDLYMFAGHNCLCDIADEQPLLYHCWSQLAVWHRRRTPSGLIYMLMCNRWVFLYYQSLPSMWHCWKALAGFMNGHNCLCDIHCTEQVDYFICITVTV